MSDRATDAVHGLYHSHLRECRDCRKMHRLLYALYEGPVVPPPPAGIAEEKQFHAALRRTREEQPAPWYHKWSLRAGVTAMAGAAAALTLALFGINPTDVGSPAGSDMVAIGDGGAPSIGSPHDTAQSRGGFDHPAQSYGRVLGGNAAVTTAQNSAPANTGTFPVGTRFQVDDDQALQVGLVGKIVANFTPGSDIEWRQATPMLELQVNRGIAAVRYDRRSSDPVLYVRTPSAVVRVVGTVFTVEVDENEETIVSVLRGQVDVLDPETNSLRAEVESGDRYEVATSSHGNVGRNEVEAALPLSNEADADSSDFTNALALADGHIPLSWNVPGLPDDPNQRMLAYVPKPSAEPTTFEVPVVRRRSGGGSAAPAVEDDSAPLIIDDDAGDLIERLMDDVKKTRGQELRAELSNCRKLYASHATRYRAARCLSDFISKYGEEPAAVEGYLLVGMLRMDYALDYRAADNAFEEFLRRAPRNHASREMAMYRMWLSATEDGRISEALTRGRRYLKRFPHGKYVGKILLRFEELKADF